MQKVLVGKKGTDPLYGSSKTANTKNTALNPESLRDGAIGVYGLQGTDPTTSANSGKWVLITDSATGAGITSKSEFKGKLIKICQGDSTRVSGYIESGIIDISTNFSVDAVASSAYQKQISYIGYNPSSGLGKLNFTSLPSVGEFIGIKSFKKLDGAHAMETYEWSIVQNEDESFFDSLSALVQEINNSTYGGTHFTVGITCDAPNDTDPTQDMTIVQGSADASIAAADTAYAIGTYIKISNNVYKIVAKPTSTTITFDRVVEEASQTIAAASVDILDVTEYPTSGYSQFGIKISANLDDERWNFSVEGNLTNATVVNYQLTKKGSGLGTEVLAMEKQSLPNRGNMHTAQVEFLQTTDNGTQIPKTTVNSSGYYDMYIVSHGNYMGEKDWASSMMQGVEIHKTIVAFEVPALGSGNGNTDGHNQSDFEDVITGLYSLTPQIAA